jgi:beta-lactamase regulating signal transducer with metallopeptidase domain
MIAPWILYTLAISTLVAGAALGLERIARLLRLPLRWIWLAAVIGSIAVPVIADLFARAASAHVAAGSHITATALPTSFNTPLLIVWGAMSLFVAVRMIVAILRLRHRKRHWRADTIDGAPVLRAADVGPALIGVIHPQPVVPSWIGELSAEEQALVMRHESEHADAHDPWLAVVGAVSTIVAPWNPVLWWSVRRLRLAIELDCDARVLRAGADPRAYASLLLTVSERISIAPVAWATAFARPRSLLEQRIIAMTTPFRPRRLRLTIAALAIASSIALVAACEATLPDQALPGAGTSRAAAVEQPRLGDTLLGTVTVDGVPTTVKNVIYRKSAGATEREGVQVRVVPDRIITGDSIKYDSGKLTIYYEKAAPSRDRVPERP